MTQKDIPQKPGSPLLPNKTWLISILPYVAYAFFITSLYGAQTNDAITQGYTAYYGFGILTQQILLAAIGPLSYLAVIICQRTEKRTLLKFLNHLHWGLLALLMLAGRSYTYFVTG